MSPAANRLREEPEVVTKEDLFYDPWVTAASPALTALIDQLHAQLEEKLHDPTKRKSRRSAVSSRREALSSVVTNLMRLPEVSSMGSVLVVHLACPKKDRYTQQQFPVYLLTEMIDELEGLGLLVRTAYEFRRVCTTIKPTEKFAKLAKALGHGPHVGRFNGEETILLKKPGDRVRYASNRAPKEVKSLVDYADSTSTRRMRADMASINNALAEADIRFLEKPIGGSFMVRQFSMPKGVTVSGFEWNREGRLYGGFWQSLRKDMRQFIELDGEPVCDLDFRAMHVALAYRLARAVLPDDDPYVGIVGLQGETMRREDTKSVVLNLLHRRTPMTSFPRDRDLVASLRKQGWQRGRDIQAAVELKHPAIAHMFAQGIGMSLMWMESEVLIGTLLGLADAEISALSMHDGLLCPRSKMTDVAAAMRNGSGRVLAGLGLGGEPLAVVEKAIPRT